MTGKEITLKQILVALDDVEQLQSVLEAAAVLAVRVQAELTGLLVQDEDLLQLAHLPFASEISLCSATPRTLEPLAVERQHRLRAERLRRALKRLETEHRLRTSLQVVRGRLAPETVFTQVSADVVFIVGRRQHVDRMEAARRAPTRRVAPICVYYDYSESAGRVLEVGANLSTSMQARLIVIFPEESEPPHEALKTLSARLGSPFQHIEVQLKSIGVKEGLADLVRRQHCRLLVLAMPRAGAVGYGRDSSMMLGIPIALVR